MRIGKITVTEGYRSNKEKEMTKSLKKKKKWLHFKEKLTFTKKQSDFYCFFPT